MKSFAMLFASWSCLVLPAWSGAAEVRNLYEAEIAVNSQSPVERLEAIHSGLITVLVKVTGKSDIALTPGIPQLLGRSQQLLQQYRYRVEQVSGASGASIPQTWLWLRYNDSAIDSALREAAIPIWGRNRPNTLAWLAIESAGTRRLLGEQDNDLRLLLQREASRRGIPLVLPLLDLEDQAAMKVGDLWANFQDNIMAASARYATNGILAGRLREVAAGSGRWDVRWTYYLGGKVYDWGLAGQGDAVIANGINGVADTLASLYVNTTASRQGELRVLVSGVRTVEDYARCEAFLRGLDSVTDVQPIQVSADRVLYRIMLRSDRDGFAQMVRLSDRRLFNEVVLPPVIAAQPGSIQPGPVQTAADIVYELLP